MEITVKFCYVTEKAALSNTDRCLIPLLSD